MIIRGLNIFLTWKQSEILVSDEVKMEMLNLPSVNQYNFEKVFDLKNRILIEEIKKISDKNPIEFVQKWMKFELFGEEAIENTWNLLNDYKFINGNCYLEDIRPNQKKLELDYSGENYSYYPIGRKFFLVFFNSEKTNWYGKIIERKKSFKIQIDVDDVVKLEGELKSFFTIHTKEQLLQFSCNNVEIIKK